MIFFLRTFKIIELLFLPFFGARVIDLRRGRKKRKVEYCFEGSHSITRSRVPVHGKFEIISNKISTNLRKV